MDKKDFDIVDVKPITCAGRITRACPFTSIVKGNSKIFGRDKEYKLLRVAMKKQRMKNVVLIGPAGSGKTALVEKFAYDMKEKLAVVKLDITGLQSGTQYMGVMEEKMIKFLNAVKAAGDKVVIFIDEIHMIYHCGMNASGSAMDVGNMLKQALSSGEITIIGCTTEEEFKETIAKDRALVRRLSPIIIPEMERQNVYEIMRRFYGKKIEDDMLEYICDKTDVMYGRSNPDLAIDVLDWCKAFENEDGTKLTKDLVDYVIEELLAQI